MEEITEIVLTVFGSILLGCVPHQFFSSSELKHGLLISNFSTEWGISVDSDTDRPLVSRGCHLGCGFAADLADPDSSGDDPGSHAVWSHLSAGHQLLPQNHH